MEKQENSEVLNKRIRIQERIDDLTKENIFVAFSGGADSSLILKLSAEAADKNGTKVYAVMIHTKLHPVEDLEVARRVAAEVGAEFRVLELDELKETGIENNPKNRCYLCKKGLFSKMQDAAKKAGIRYILEGTNEDDLHVYRPGIQALKELGIISPLAEGGLTKQEVRSWLADLGISVAERPSSPCLATRLPYGDTIDYELLSRIDQGETFIKELGFTNVRLRIHKNIARIEVDKKDLGRMILKSDCVIDQLKKLGFFYITIDLEGFRSGSMDID